ncbi:hypothetical protein EJB05_30873, partial [Eragrostis curvula]
MTDCMISCALLTRWRALQNVLPITLLQETYATPAAQVLTNFCLRFHQEINTINFSVHTTSSAQPTIIHPKEHKRKRARERYAQMPKDQKEEFLKKRREAYRQRKSKAIDANVEQEKSYSFRSDQSRSKEYTLLATVKACTNVDTHTYENPSRRKLTNEKTEAKRARNRAYYANMTNEQRLARCERQREQYALRSTLPRRMRYTNMTPEQKQAKIDRQK